MRNPIVTACRGVAERLKGQKAQDIRGYARRILREIDTEKAMRLAAESYEMTYEELHALVMCRVWSVKADWEHNVKRQYWTHWHRVHTLKDEDKNFIYRRKGQDFWNWYKEVQAGEIEIAPEHQFVRPLSPWEKDIAERKARESA